MHNSTDLKSIPIDIRFVQDKHYFLLPLLSITKKSNLEIMPVVKMKLAIVMIRNSKLFH